MNSANINGKDLDLMPLNKCIESLNKNRYDLYQSQGAGKKEFLDIFYRKNIIIDLSSLALALYMYLSKNKIYNRTTHTRVVASYNLFLLPKPREKIKAHPSRSLLERVSSS